MRKIAAILLLAFSILNSAFAVTGVQCPQVKDECMNSACVAAGGNISESQACMHLEGFNNDTYAAHKAQCENLDEYCRENDGLIHNMSLCGPVFIFLPLLLSALCARDN
jgi:hypothetical protein